MKSNLYETGEKGRRLKWTRPERRKGEGASHQGEVKSWVCNQHNLPKERNFRICCQFFSREHFDMCSSKVSWNGIYLYKNSKRRRWWRGKNTASREDSECVVSQWFDSPAPPPQGSALNLLPLSFYWYYNGTWYTLIQKLKCLFLSYVSPKSNQE